MNTTDDATDARPSFEELLAGVTPYVHRLADGIARQHGMEREDAAQELMMLMCHFHDKYDPRRSRPTTWTALLARTCSWRLSRRKKQVAAHQFPTDLDGHTFDLIDPRAGDPADEPERGEALTTLRDAMRTLPERLQLILRLRAGWDGERVTLGEAASQLGITRERVRQLEAQALQRLAEEMGLDAEKVATVSQACQRRPRKKRVRVVKGKAADDVNVVGSVLAGVGAMVRGERRERGRER